jgi:hypothetical protein
MPQCQFPVFAVFVFQKSYTRNILRIGQNKANNSYFPKRHGLQSWDGGAPGARRTIGWRSPAQAVPLGGVAAWPTFWRRPSAYIFPSMVKPKGTNQFSTKRTASHRRRRCEIGKVQKLFPAPCQRGESLPEAFFITMPASEVMRE